MGSALEDIEWEYLGCYEEKAQGGKKQYPRRMRILVVEDDENTSALIISMLHRLDPGFEIEVAADGDAGLKSYLRSFQDLVITDYAHPGLLGVELAEVVRQTSWRRRGMSLNR